MLSPMASGRCVGRAAIEGQVFHAAQSQRSSPTTSATKSRRCISNLVRKDLVRPEPGDAFRFRHLLIRDAAYAALPKELRADLHARFAEWLEAGGGADTRARRDRRRTTSSRRSSCALELGYDREEQRELADAAAQTTPCRRTCRRTTGPTFPAAIAFLRRGVDLLTARRSSSHGRSVVARPSAARSRRVRARGRGTASSARPRRDGRRSRRLRSGPAPAREHRDGEREPRRARRCDSRTVRRARPGARGDSATSRRSPSPTRAIGTSRFVLGRAAEGEADLERAAELARQAGEVSEELRALNALLRPKLWGPAPAETLARAV